MSIVRMRKLFQKKIKVKAGRKNVNLPSLAEMFFYVIILIFIIGAYSMFGGPGKTGGAQKAANTQQNLTSVVATVNGEKISRELYDANSQMTEQRMSEPDITQERYLRTGTLNRLIDAILMRQAVRKEGVKVSGAEINAEKEKELNQIISSRFPDQKAEYRFLKKENKTLDEYKDELRKEAFKDAEALKDQVASDKLQKAKEAAVTMTDAELTDSYSEVQASHILISSKKMAENAQKSAKPGQTSQTPVDGDALAKQKADDLLAQIQKGADFATLAKANSDDPGSAAKGGDLGWFKRGMMVPEFDTAVFQLQPGQVTTAPVKTDFGYHIIKVIAKRQNLPKDFDKSKEMYRQQALEQKKSRVWEDYKKQLTKDAKIVIVDPELAAYRLLDEGKQAEGIQMLADAVKKSPGNAVAGWELAQLLEQQKDLKGATETLEQVSVTDDGARNPMVHVKLGDLYMAQGNKAKALPEYKDAFDRASAFTMQNFMANMQVESKLKALGDNATAAQCTKWLDDYRKQQQSNPMGGMGMGGPMGNFQIPAQ